MKIARFCILLGLLFLLGCSDTLNEAESLSFPFASGKIQFFGHESVVMDLKDGTINRIEWQENTGPFNAKYLCNSHRGSIILQCDRVFGDSSYVYFGDTLYTSTPLYYYEPLNLISTNPDSLLEFITVFKHNHFSCYSLDYCAEKQIYLYSGEYKGVRGAYLLDTTFAIVKDISNMFYDVNRQRYLFAYRFVDSNNIIVTSKEQIGILDIRTGDYRKLTEGYIRGQSKDRKNIVVSGLGNKIFIINVSTGEKLIIATDSQMRDVTFSPDNKFLLIMRYEDIGFFRRAIPYIYDLNSRIISKLDPEDKILTKWNSCIWVE